MRLLLLERFGQVDSPNFFARILGGPIAAADGEVVRTKKKNGGHESNEHYSHSSYHSHEEESLLPPRRELDKSLGQSSWPQSFEVQLRKNPRTNHLSFQRRRRKALPITTRSDSPMAAAQRIGLIKPNAAKGIPTAL
jgi:hypothetical protein